MKLVVDFYFLKKKKNSTFRPIITQNGTKILNFRFQ